MTSSDLILPVSSGPKHRTIHVLILQDSDLQDETNMSKRLEGYSAALRSDSAIRMVLLVISPSDCRALVALQEKSDTREVPKEIN